MPSSLLCPMSLSVPTSPTWPIDLSLCSSLPVIFSVYPSAVLCSSLHWGPIFPICTHLPVSSPNPCPSLPTSVHLPHFCPSPSTSVHLPQPGPCPSISLYLPPSPPTRSMSLHLHPPPLPVCLSHFCPSLSTHLSPSTSIHLPHSGPSPHLCPSHSISIRPSSPCPSPHFSAPPLSALPILTLPCLSPTLSPRYTHCWVPGWQQHCHLGRGPLMPVARSCKGQKSKSWTPTPQSLPLPPLNLPTPPLAP